MKQPNLAALLAVAALGTALPSASNEAPGSILPRVGKVPWKRYSYRRESCQEFKELWDWGGIDMYCGTKQLCDLFDSATGSDLSALQESGFADKKACLEGHHDEPATDLFPWVESTRDDPSSLCSWAEDVEVNLESFDMVCGTEHLCKSYYTRYELASEQACLDIHEKPWLIQVHAVN